VLHQTKTSISSTPLSNENQAVLLQCNVKSGSVQVTKQQPSFSTTMYMVTGGTAERRRAAAEN